MSCRRSPFGSILLVLVVTAGCELAGVVTEADSEDGADVSGTGPEGGNDLGPQEASCGNSMCEPGEACVACPGDCPQCVACSDGVCDPYEDCRECPEDCGACPTVCGDGNCEAGESCDSCPSDCADCATCPNGVCESFEDCSTCSADCGECPPYCGDAPCSDGERCVDGPTTEPFCTTCDPDGCATFGVSCCPDGPADGGCTNTFTDPNNCGACNVACGPDELCNGGACEPTGAASACSFDPMQWWRSPTRTSRDITFVAVADPHATDPATECPNNANDTDDQHYLAAQAIHSVLPSIFWPTHVWPSGYAFYREGSPYDHVRGLIIPGDLTQAGSQSIPAGAAVCREYRSYRDAFGRCGDEGRLPFPVYDGYGNHDFPRTAGAGDASFHPVVDYLDAITAAHRPGGASSLYDDPSAGTGHYAWRWDDIWFVNLDLKPGLNVLDLSKPAGSRLADPHSSRGFLKSFLLSRTNNSTRQIVLISHYPLSSSKVGADEKESLCRLLHNAQYGEGSFSGQKLSRTDPVVAFLHGHNHAAPIHTDWTCPAPYNAITIPQFSVGTPNYLHPNNDGNLQFTIFRIGNSKLEALGVSASPAAPTGPWSYVYGERLDIMRAP